MDEQTVTEGHAINQPQAEMAEKLLNDARQALKAGNQEAAYRLSLEATRQDQDNKDAWLMRASVAASTEERLLCLSQAIRLDPNHPMAKNELYTILKVELEHDPYLAYLNETGQVYFVRNEQYQSLAVPKERNVPETYPPERPKALAGAYRWLILSVFGLALAGIGTLLFAPLAFRLAVSTLNQPLSKPDRIRARLVIWLSILLAAIALVLAWLLIVHFLG